MAGTGSEGRPATFWGGWSEMVNAKGKNVQAAKDFVKWLWIENTATQQDWSLSYGFHVPPRISAAETAEPLKEGAPAEAVKILYDNGQFTPPQYTTAMDTIMKDALAHIVKEGARPPTRWPRRPSSARRSWRAFWGVSPRGIHLTRAGTPHPGPSRAQGEGLSATVHR